MGHIFRRWASRIWSKISWNLHRNVRFQILTTVYVDKAVPWDVTICSSVDQVRCLSGTCGLCIQCILMPGDNSLTIWPCPMYVLKGYSQPSMSLTHWGRVTQICVFNTRLFSLHNTLNYAVYRACLRMVLLTDVYRNLTSPWINL